MQIRHSGQGIAALLLAALGALLLLLMVVAAGYVELTTPGGLQQQPTAALLLTVLVLASIALELVALALGIVGVTRRDRRRLFPVLGLVLASATLLGVLGLTVLGMMN